MKIVIPLHPHFPSSHIRVQASFFSSRYPMPSRKKPEAKNLYVSRNLAPIANNQIGDTPSRSDNEVVGEETNASTLRAHEDPLYDEAIMAFHSSNESNDDIHVSDQREVDHSVDEPHTSNSTEPTRRKKGRGETTCKNIHLMDSDKVIRMERNVYGQFVGDGKVQLSSFMGTLIRNVSLFPMISQSWTHVSNYSKDTTWNLIKHRFDVNENDKKHIMELLRESFRDYKAKFKSMYYRPSDTPASVIARGGPKNMPASQFADMVTYWYSSKGKNISEKNKVCRSKQTGAHALGRMSLANRKKMLANELGREPSRLELYLDSRTSKKKGKILVDDEATSKKVALDKAVEEQLSQCPPDTPMVDIHEAAFRSTFGEEYYGRCRGMGTGVTAIQVYPELSRRTQSTGMRQRKSNESEEIAKLKSQMATMQTTMDFLVEAISHQGGRDDRSGTSGEPGIHLYPDQFVRMMSLIRGKNSNNETTSNDTPETNHSTRANFEEGDTGENGGGIA